MPVQSCDALDNFVCVQPKGKLRSLLADSVQRYPWARAPCFFAVPQIYGSNDATLAWEIDHSCSASGSYAVADWNIFFGAVAITNDETIKADRSSGNAELNRAKGAAGRAAYINRVMVAAAVDTGVAEQDHPGLLPVCGTRADERRQNRGNEL